jgi:hypothetical protein
MILADVIGMVFTAVMGIGLIGSLVDLLIKIHRQPKRKEPLDLVSLSPYPLVPELVRADDR